MKLVLGSFSLVLLAVLAGCGETPQQQASRADEAPASQGTGSQFVAGNWKRGDAASWNDQMRQRAQYGQNEYSRSTAP